MPGQTYDRLISYLAGWGTSATRTRDGHIRIEYVDRRGRSVTAYIVITPDEWDTIAGTVWGDFDAAVTQVVTPALLRLGDRRERYLVCDQYALEPSLTPQIPDDDPHRLTELEPPPRHPPTSG